VDTKTWLPDDLLIKADKITMANSLELRVPLLDHRVLEFGAALPPSLKVHGITTKYLLKKALEPRVPSQILNRPKTGFPVPYAQWLRQDLRETVSSILLDPSTARRGYFSARAVEALLQSNETDGAHAKEIFSLLTLELWHRTFVDPQLDHVRGCPAVLAGDGAVPIL
jgi:asparagine synthase (glutamine-hydrolysing)